MADQKSIARSISDLKRFNSTLNPRLSMKLWLDEKEEEKGVPIPIKSIAEFRLRESMFLKLPVGHILYSDDGTFKNSNTFRPGRILYIAFEYKPMTTDSNKSNISLGRYRIENVKILNNSKQTVVYSVAFIQDSLGFINSVPKYPDEANADFSFEVMETVCGSVGVPFSSGVDTSDLMYWFNPGMRCCDFISFLVSHSFISEDDFGMFWINKNGEAKFDGMKNIIQNGKPYFFESKDGKEEFTSKHLIFLDMFEKDKEELSGEDLAKKYGNSCWILFKGDQRNNDSWEAQLFGNSVEVKVFDPFLRTYSYKSDDIETDVPSFVTHTISNKQIQSGTPANDTTNANRVQKIVTKGYINPDLDNFWDISPEHNKLMRAEFFANRHTISINTGKQLDCFAKQDFKIGDPIDIDFQRPFDKNPSADSGKYIIHTIDWKFKKDTDLEVQLRVASDVLHPVKQV